MPQPQILIVDDEPTNLLVLAENLAAEGYETTTATRGEKAWQLLVRDPDRFQVILLDRMMPDLDGIDILRRMKSETRLAHTPVIMQTSMTSPSDVAEGLRSGAYYYLTKPFSADMLIAIVNAAIGDHREWLALQNEVRQATGTLSCMAEARFVFRTREEARNIATLVANVAPDPGRVVMGLSELMLNAIEHGNLGITYSEKTQLIADDRLHGEVERRLVLPEYAARRAALEFSRASGEIRFVVRDDGDGFDWQSYLEISPERAFDTHGRGIAMSRMLSFDHMEYRGKGNEVLCRIIC